MVEKGIFSLGVEQTAAYNSFVIFGDVCHKKTPYIDFFINVAEALIDVEKEGVPKKRTRRVGRHSLASVMIQNAGDHMPVKEKATRR